MATYHSNDEAKTDDTVGLSVARLLMNDPHVDGQSQVTLMAVVRGFQQWIRKRR